MSAGRTINSKSKDWGTPLKYVKAVKDFFGGEIDLDPCSNNYSIVKAKTEYILPKTDGLKDSWNYKTIYVNPPYGINKSNKTSIKNWLYKCAKANEDYGSQVVALVPVATNTAHWKHYVWTKATAVCFLYDTRLKFLINGKDEGKGAPMSCSMIYWGNEYQKFYSIFKEFGSVIDLRHLRGEHFGVKNGMHHQISMQGML
jgi:hypothetical protein